jgi:hypothetical protein
MAALLARSERPVLLLGNGGHEIGQVGMAHALAHYAPKPDDVALWFHFGASIAATALDARFGGASPQFVIGTPKTAELAQRALIPAMTAYTMGSASSAGEAGQVLGAGFDQFVSMIGHFPTFHTPADRGEAVDYGRLETVAKGVKALLEQASL